MHKRQLDAFLVAVCFHPKTACALPGRRAAGVTSPPYPKASVPNKNQPAKNLNALITGAQQISRIRQLAGVQQEPLPVVWAEPPFTFDLIGSIILVMNTAAKLLSSMRRNPLDWQISQLQSVARQHGIDWRHNGTSHCVFIRGDGQTLPVPAHRPIKPIYIKKFVELVDGA